MLEFFFDKKWRFYIAEGNNQFITSDTPAVEWFPKRQFFYGPTIFERKHYLTLTPKILVELSHPNEPGKRVKRKTLNDMEVLKYNMIIVDYSDRFCYSNRKKELQRLLELMGVAKAKFLANLRSGQSVDN